MTEPEPKGPPPHRRVADELRAEIVAGHPPRGAELPKAGELAERFRVGKTTVHRALSTLRDEGLLDIRAGVGAFVREWTPILRDANQRLSAKQWGSGHSIWDADLQGRPMKVVTTTKTTSDVPREVRAQFDCETYLVRHRLFMVEREKVQLATSYLDAGVAAGSAIEGADTGAGGTFARLDEMGLKPSRFREDIRVRKPTQAEAEELDIGPNRSVIEIMRENATEDQRVVEMTHMVLVADAYVLRYHMHS